MTSNIADEVSQEFDHKKSRKDILDADERGFSGFLGLLFSTMKHMKEEK